MKEQERAVTILLVLLIIFLMFRVSTYNIIVPNEHHIGTTDDAIHLVGSKPVSPLLTESVTYEFLDTLARLKGVESVGDILMVDFQGMSVQEVSEMLQGVNVDELIAYVKTKGYDNPEVDPYDKELLLHESLNTIRDDGTGIDCTKCKWKQHTTTTPQGIVVDSGIKQCVYEGNGYEVDCNPGICNPIDGKDPWPDIDPWTPSDVLEKSWECGKGKVSIQEGRCLAYDKIDPTKCVEHERLYSDYTPVTPVLNN